MPSLFFKRASKRPDAQGSMRSRSTFGRDLRGAAPVSFSSPPEILFVDVDEVDVPAFPLDEDPRLAMLHQRVSRPSHTSCRGSPL